MASSNNRTLLLIATALSSVGCQSGAATKAMNPTVNRGTAMLQAQSNAVDIQQMRSAGLAAAEARVAASPDDLAARRTLAQAYFASGRFRSAAQAYEDALKMAPDDDGLRLRRALALLVQGSQAAAVAELDRIRDLPDAGLAYALAGQSARGIELLTEAARQPHATARTRQNLALAYAFDGQWARARVIASQDLDPTAIEMRIRQWAELAVHGDVAAQTARLLAVQPVDDDAGRPIGLAYIPPESRLQQQASIAPAIAAPAPRTVEVAAVAPIDVTPIASPVVQVAAPAEPVAAAVAKRAAAKPVAVATSAPRSSMVRKASATVTSVGRWVVQLAAYDRPDVREENWKRLAARNADLVGDYAAVRSEVMVGDRRYYRLGLAGFDGRSEAIELCESLRAKGRSCFVREAVAAPAQRTAAVRRDPPQA